MRRSVLGLVALVLLLAPAPALAQTGVGGERVASLDVVLTVGDDGGLVVEETIAYDFGGASRRGIYRDVPTRFTYDDRNDRVYPLRVLEVSSETAPDDYVVREEGRLTRIRIGDPDRTTLARTPTASSTAWTARSTASRSTTSCTGTRSAVSGRCRSAG